MPNPSASGQSASACETIRFLRACYEADNREMAVGNLLHKTIRHLTFLDGDEHLLREMLSRVPLDRERAVVAQKEAHLHQREKSLLYCAFPIVGKSPARVQQQSSARLCACSPRVTWGQGATRTSGTPATIAGILWRVVCICIVFR